MPPRKLDGKNSNHFVGNGYYQVDIGQRVEYVDFYAVLLRDKLSR